MLGAVCIAFGRTRQFWGTWYSKCNHNGSELVTWKVLYNPTKPRNPLRDIAPLAQANRHASMTPCRNASLVSSNAKSQNKAEKTPPLPHFVEDEYFVTALVPSDTACLASSPGRINRTLHQSVAESRTMREEHTMSVSL